MDGRTLFLIACALLLVSCAAEPGDTQGIDTDSPQDTPQGTDGRPDGQPDGGQEPRERTPGRIPEPIEYPESYPEPSTGSVMDARVTNCIESHEPEDAARGRIIVGFVDGLSEEEAEEIVTGFGFSVSDRGLDFETNPWFLVEVPEGSEVEWACTFPLHDEVAYAELDTIATTQPV